MTTLTVDVYGTPIPQGSTRAFTNPKTGRPIITNANKKTKGWRQDVTAATHNAIAATGWTKLTGPVVVDIVFHLARPKGHYGTGRNAHRLKDSAPAVPAVKPDLDKLTRAILDSLTDAAAFTDDAQVARLVVEKRYAAGPTGARILLAPLAGQFGGTSPSAAADPSSSTAAAEAPQGALL